MCYTYVMNDLLCLPQTFVRRARKMHRCRECGEAIFTHSQYAEYLGESAGYQSGHRYHLGACADKQLGVGMTDALIAALNAK